MKLIESNPLFSVGEIIQGGPIPENPLHSQVPHDGFDDEGFLKSEAKVSSGQPFGLDRSNPRCLTIIDYSKRNSRSTSNFGNPTICS